MAIEKLDRILTFLGTIKDVFDMLGKAGDAIPEGVKQKMPKLFGLTLDDERIFEAVLSQLEPKDQVLIGRFLFEKCKDYERNRFINIVAGMEVVPGKPSEIKVEIDKKSGKETRNEKPGSTGRDNRLEFLRSFAKIIKDEFGEDLDKVYDFCVAGRMIIPDPLHRKALSAFSESIGQFKTFVLTPLEVSSLEELAKKVGDKVLDEAADIASSTRSFRENSALRLAEAKARRMR